MTGSEIRSRQRVADALAEAARAHEAVAGGNHEAAKEHIRRAQHELYMARTELLARQVAS